MNMRRIPRSRFIGAASAGAALLFAAASLPQDVSNAAGGIQLETIATTEKNGLEGLDVARDGTIFVTDATAHLIYKVAPDRTLSVFARLPVVPQVVLLTSTGAVVTAQVKDPHFGAPKPGVPRELPSAQAMGGLEAVVVVLDKEGNVTKTIHGEAGAFFNGMDRYRNTYLIADSTAGTIWQLDVDKGTVEAWLKDAVLVGANGRFPGANGLKVVAGTVYVANTSVGALYRIGTDSKGKPKGAPQLIANVPRADDFAVATDGTIYIPSEGKILKVTAAGAVTQIAEGCTGCDSALLTDHEHSLLLVTHGFGPDAGPGRVYRLRLAP